MAARAVAVLAEIRQHGVHKTGGDRPVRCGGGVHSVDVCLWHAPTGYSVLCEMKWTRGSLSVALTRAKQSFGFLRSATRTGAWVCSRRAVHAGAVGALAVSPRSWTLYMQAVDRSWSKTLSHSTPQQHKRKHYRSGASKRRGNLNAQAVERAWRKSKKGKVLATKLKNTYRATIRGISTRRRETIKRRGKRPSL